MKASRALGDGTTTWVEGAIELSDRPSTRPRISGVICTLWFGEQSLQIPVEIYSLIKSQATLAETPGLRSAFSGAVQFASHSGVLLRVKTAQGGMIYALPGLV